MTPREAVVDLVARVGAFRGMACASARQTYGSGRRRLSTPYAPIDSWSGDGLGRLDIDPPARARQCRVVRRGFLQRDVKERARAQLVGRPPRNRPFRGQPFEVANRQQPEVEARRQTRPANPVGVERREARTALRRTHGSRPRGAHDPGVHRTGARGPRRGRAGHPHRRLPHAAAVFAHCHARESSTGIRPVDPYPGLSPQAARPADGAAACEVAPSVSSCL